MSRSSPTIIAPVSPVHATLAGCGIYDYNVIGLERWNVRNAAKVIGSRKTLAEQEEAFWLLGDQRGRWVTQMSGFPAHRDRCQRPLEDYSPRFSLPLFLI
jgi:hypothetical protein